MAAPQGLFRFGGLRGLCSASFTLGLGTAPSMATMYVAPQSGQLPANGTLQLTYDGGQVSFPDCHLMDVHFEIRPDGFEVWALSIADCRWRWRYPVISGEYNVRMDDQRLNPKTVKPARELAKLLFDKLKFPRADVSKVPNDAFPEFHWEYNRVDGALQDLLEPLGLRVSLRAGNQVRVVETGIGANLPTSGVLSASLTVSPPERPDSLVFVAGRSQWQADFPLQAVGQDFDGKVKPIDQLSYKPDVGWEYFDRGLAHQIKNQKNLKLARKTIFKWYQPKLPVRLPTSGDPKQDVVVAENELWRIQPMGERQLIKARFPADNGLREETLPPWVYGQYYTGGASAKNNTEKLAEITGDVESYPNTLYTQPFQFDNERALVMFEDPVYQMEDAPGDSYGKLVKEARLFLRVSCPLRDAETRQFYHFEVERKLPGKKLGTSPKYIVKDDISAKAYYEWVNGAVKQNRNIAEVNEYAKHYLDAEQQRLLGDQPAKCSYAGFRDIALDGAIQQVTWQVSEGGFATTAATRNSESFGYAPTFADKRFDQQARDIIQLIQWAEADKKRLGLR